MSASEPDEMDKAINILDVWSLFSRQSRSIATARCIRSGMRSLFEHIKKSMYILVHLCLYLSANMRLQGQQIEAVCVVAVENPSLYHLDATPIENTPDSPFSGYHKLNSGSHPIILQRLYIFWRKKKISFLNTSRSKGYRR